MMTLRQEIRLTRHLYGDRGFWYACRIGWSNWRLMRRKPVGPVDRFGLDEEQRRTIINRAVDATLPPSKRRPKPLKHQGTGWPPFAPPAQRPEPGRIPTQR